MEFVVLIQLSIHMAQGTDSEFVFLEFELFDLCNLPLDTRK